jgi:hypothetical protein
MCDSLRGRHRVVAADLEGTPTMKSGHRTRRGARLLCMFAFACITAIAAAGKVSAQERALAIEDIERLFQRFSPTGVLNSIRGQCVDFQASDPQIRQRLSQAGADAAFLDALATFCFRPRVAAEVSPEPPPIVLLSPGGAALRSALLPGAGQIYSGRRFAGAAFLGAAAGMVAVSLLSESVTVLCTSGAGGPCQPEHVVAEESRSRFGPGLAGYVIVAAASAFEAYSAAKRVNRTRSPGAGSTSGSSRNSGFSLQSIQASGSGVRLELLRFHF